MTVHVLIACHNRRALTVAAIQSLRLQSKQHRIDLALNVFDDGSSDGTTEALERLGGINILRGDGHYYWAAAMSTLEQHVLETAATSNDYVLWLNDDVHLDTDALPRALAEAVARSNTLLVGATLDPVTGRTSYSGLLRSGVHPLALTRVEPSAEAQPVDTMNGNFVLVPVEAARRLKGIDGGFAHGLADIDYGFRARRAGIDVLLLPGSVGRCSRNPVPYPTSVLAAWRHFTSAKGAGHKPSMQRLLRRQQRLLWPLAMGITYGLWWARALTTAIRSPLTARVLS